MRCGVTGAAGFIGSHLCEELLRRGCTVVGFDSFTDYYDVRLKELNAEGLDIRRIDLAEDPLDFSGLDCLYHLAGQPGVRSFGAVFPHYVQRNVLATQRVFEAAAEAGIRVVFASSSSVYGDAETYPTVETTEPRPVSPYGITKLACEHLAVAYEKGFGLDCATVRYFTIYGPRQRPDMAFTRLFTALAQGEEFELYGDGGHSRGFTYVADAVDATIRVMEGGSGIYNVGGATEATMAEIIDLAQAISGQSLNLKRLPPVPGDVRRTNADTTRLRAELGWKPQLDLAEGLEAHWAWANKTLAIPRDGVAPADRDPVSLIR